jgi:hypothetical protein
MMRPDAAAEYLRTHAREFLWMEEWLHSHLQRQFQRQGLKSAFPALDVGGPAASRDNLKHVQSAQETLFTVHQFFEPVRAELEKARAAAKTKRNDAALAAARVTAAGLGMEGDTESAQLILGESRIAHYMAHGGGFQHPRDDEYDSASSTDVEGGDERGSLDTSCWEDEDDNDMATGIGAIGNFGGGYDADFGMKTALPQSGLPLGNVVAARVAPAANNRRPPANAGAAVGGGVAPAPGAGALPAHVIASANAAAPENGNAPSLDARFAELADQSDPEVEVDVDEGGAPPDAAAEARHPDRVESPRDAANPAGPASGTGVDDEFVHL